MKSISDKFIIDALLRAGDIALNIQEHQNITLKDRHEAVTNVDIKIQDFLIEKLKDYVLTKNIYSEELKNIDDLADDKSELKVLIDPLDGTHNYIHSLPQWGIALSLLNNLNIPTRSYIYIPMMKYLVYSGEDSRTKVFDIQTNSTQLCSSSSIGKMSQSMYLYDNQFYKLEKKSRVLYEKLTKSCFTTRILGSSAFDITVIARGSIQARFWNNCKSYDIAAAIPILRNSGALLVDENYQITENIFNKIFIGICNQSNLEDLKNTIGLRSIYD